MKPHLWKENGIWKCSYARDGLIVHHGKTPLDAYRARKKWLAYDPRDAHENY